MYINKPCYVSFRARQYGEFTNFVQRGKSVWGSTHCQSEFGLIDMSKFGHNGANILGGEGVLPPFQQKCSFQLICPSKHSVLRGATHKTKSPHKAPHSTPPTLQCSFDKSWRDAQTSPTQYAPLNFFEGGGIIRVATGQGNVREINFFFKVREKSGNFANWSGKF